MKILIFATLCLMAHVTSASIVPSENTPTPRTSVNPDILESLLGYKSIYAWSFYNVREKKSERVDLRDYYKQFNENVSNEDLDAQIERAIWVATRKKYPATFYPAKVFVDERRVIVREHTIAFEAPVCNEFRKLHNAGEVLNPKVIGYPEKSTFYVLFVEDSEDCFVIEMEAFAHERDAFLKKIAALFSQFALLTPSDANVIFVHAKEVASK